MKSKIKLWVYCQAVFLIVSLSSCAKLVSGEFPEFEPKPVLNLILVEGRPIMAQLSFAEKIDTTYLTLINDAEIQISNASGATETLLPQGEGVFSSPINVHQNGRYACVVYLNGFPDMHAQDTVPKTIEAKITSHTNKARYSEEGTFMEGIAFEFYDNPATKDYYEVIIRSTSNSQTITQYAFNENCKVLLNEGLEPYSTETLVFSDQLIEDSLVLMQLEFSPDSWSSSCWGDSCFQIIYEHAISLEMRHISREYYNYKKHFYLYEKGRYPYFVEGTATAFPFYSNVENGFGVMAGYALCVDSIFVEEEKIPL